MAYSDESEDHGYSTNTITKPSIKFDKVIVDDEEGSESERQNSLPKKITLRQRRDSSHKDDLTSNAVSSNTETNQMSENKFSKGSLSPNLANIVSPCILRSTDGYKPDKQRSKEKVKNEEIINQMNKQNKEMENKMSTLLKVVTKMESNVSTMVEEREKRETEERIIGRMDTINKEINDRMNEQTKEMFLLKNKLREIDSNLSAMMEERAKRETEERINGAMDAQNKEIEIVKIQTKIVTFEEDIKEMKSKLSAMMEDRVKMNRETEERIEAQIKEMKDEQTKEMELLKETIALTIQSSANTSAADTDSDINVRSSLEESIVDEADILSENNNVLQ